MYSSKGPEGAAMPSSKLTLSPLKPRIACIDRLHNLHVMDLEGLSYGPRIVTAAILHPVSRKKETLP